MMFGLCALAAISISAQKKKKEDFKDILHTKDIAKIERFLTAAHPQDPRRTVLKPKLVSLKNAAWTEGRKNAQPMSARPILPGNSAAVVNSSHASEAEEFRQLMRSTQEEHKTKTVSLLNVLFDEDKNKQDAILLIQNRSDCNLILRIHGKDEFYRLAVPAKGENSIVVKKGSYELSSNICDGKYTSRKDLAKNHQIILNAVTVQNKSLADNKKPKM